LFKYLRRLAIEHDLNQLYRQRLSSRGTSPQGVFWNSLQNQTNRFAALLGMIADAAPAHHDTPTLCEVGCGYGAMLEYMNSRRRFTGWRYQGVDINPTMIAACRAAFPDDKTRFKIGRKPASAIDFAVFSGTYNLCPIENIDAWETYIFDCLDDCWQQCRHGMALNLLCRSKPRINGQIYYANRDRFMDRANAVFGPTYAVPTPFVDGDVTFLISRS
jgi:SAM-dependent methyltransferase